MKGGEYKEIIKCDIETKEFSERSKTEVTTAAMRGKRGKLHDDKVRFSFGITSVFS